MYTKEVLLGKGLAVLCKERERASDVGPSIFDVLVLDGLDCVLRTRC